MKTTKRTKTFALLCALVLMLSMCSAFALAAGTYSNPIEIENADGVITSYDNDKTAPENYDISVMSYNVLESGSGSYDYPDQRLKDIVTNISVYMPDVIGVQEASDTAKEASDGSTDFVWSDKLPAALAKLGYTAIKLTDSGYTTDSNSISTTSIGTGLIVFYKSDKFTVDEKYRQNYNVGISGTTHTDSSRWFMRVKFTEKATGRPFYFYNTHMSITGTEKYNGSYLGYYYRTAQIKILFDNINATAKGYPFFAVGDYNTSYNPNNKSKPADDLPQQLYYVEQAGYYYDVEQKTGYISNSAYGADTTISATASGRIDHIYYNDDYIKAIEHRAVQENVEGRGMSDHMALVSYCNFAAEATINGNSYDEVNATYTDTTDSTSYTFDITTPDGVSYTINGSTENTVTLTKAYTDFEIKFTANGNLLNTVTATIQYTGAKTATVAATGAINTYFANDAYHLLLANGTTSTKIKVTGGTLYDGSTALASPYTVESIPAGRTQFSVTTAAGDTYPVYLYKATAAAESGNVIYVDDDMPTSGTGAVCYGDEVIYVTAGTNGANNLTTAATLANAIKKACTVYVAGGTYSGNTTAFEYTTHLLGNNADKAVTDISNDMALITDGRNEESTIIGSRVYFYTKSNDQTFTVKGFNFEGSWESDSTDDNRAAIYIYDYSSSDTSKRIKNKIHLDIQNNIFTAYGDSNSDAVIHCNSPIQKDGVIAGNYFKYTGNEGTRNNRAMQIRNLNGLVVENNRFINYPNAFWFTSEYSNTNATAYNAYCNYTVQNNYFEACNYVHTTIKDIKSSGNTYDATAADIRYLNNNFIRCGYYLGGSHGALHFTISTQETDLSTVSITVQGNNFLGCMRAVWISRSDEGTVSANMSDMTVNINRNRFYQPQERGTVQTAYLDDAVSFAFTLGDAEDLTTNWNMKYNYFYSDIFSTTDTASTYYAYTNGKEVYDPSLYITNSIQNTAGSSVTLSSDLYSPYYTNVALTKLSSSTLPTQTGITADDVTVPYDGAAHGIAVNGASEEVSTITYSTDGKVYSSVNPTFTEVGSYTVYYMVETPAYAAFTGSATVTISEAELREQTVTAIDQIYPYNGSAQGSALTVADDATVTYTVNGETVAEPTFTDAGTYTVNFTVVREGYKDYSGSYTVTINAASLADIAISGYEGYYDGNAHGVTVGDLPEGVTASYEVDGEAVDAAPIYTTPCTHSVTVTLSGANYVPRSETVTINIVAAIITGVTITPYVGEVDGQSHGVTVTGTQEGDTVYYAYNGAEYTTEEPTFTKEGRYTITVKIVRENYQDKISVATVVIDESLSKSYIKPMFTATSTSFGVTESGGKYTFSWQCTLGFSDFGEIELPKDNYRIISYGVKYSPTLEALEDYVYDYQANGYNNTGTVSGKVAEFAVETAKDGAFLTKLYKTTTYSLTKLSDVRARYAMSYIRYYDESTKTFYEELGNIEVAISNYLPDGKINGIGGTAEREDILGTNPNDGKTSEREDILGN